MQRNYNQDVPLGYQQLTPDASTALTVPAGAIFCIITTEGQALRWRDDGAAPTAAIGYPLAVGNELAYSGRLSSIRLINQVAGGISNVCYYGAPL